MRLLHLLGWALRPFLRAGIGRWKWPYAIWGLFARYFVGGTATVRVEGLTVSAPAGDGLGFNLLTQGSWEPYFMELFKESVRPRTTVVDVGAHVGLYSLVASALVGPAGKVYAFEPEPRNYDLLTRNIKDNSLTNVVPVRKAVSDRTGMVTLHVDPKVSMGHTVGRPAGGAIGIACEATSLDDFLAGQRVDFVKIDVEGAEMAVLEGMRRIISENQEIRLLCEFAPALMVEAGTQPRDFIAKLLAYGFAVYGLDERTKEATHIPDATRLALDRGCYLFCSRGRSGLPFAGR